MPPVPHVPAAEAEDHAALIVALDAGDLAGADLVVAGTLATTCAGCAELVADLVAIRDAMTSIPVPARRRDYRLGPGDAARLRPTAWRRMLDWLAAPGSSARPLATGLATLGVVGLLLTAGLPGLGAGGAALDTDGAPVENAAPAAGKAQDAVRSAGPADASLLAPAAMPSAAAPYDPGFAATPAPAPLADATPGTDQPAVAGEAPTAGPAAAGPEVQRTDAGGVSGGAEAGTTSSQRDAGSTLPLGALASAALLVAGLALSAGLVVARRRAS